MSEEEKKAVEDLKAFKSIKILYGNTFAMFTEQLTKYQEAIQTLLNLIQKQQKEIENIKKYMNNYIEVEEFNENIKSEFKEILKLLGEEE